MGKLIISDVTDDTISNYSLYRYIEEVFFREGKPITICNVTPSEYKIMERQIAGIGCLKERLRTYGREDCGYNQFRYMMTPFRSAERKLLISNYNNTEQIGNYILRADGIDYDEKGYQLTNEISFRKIIVSDFRVYTTETYEDVIAYYSAIDDRKVTVKQKTKELIEALGWNCKTCETPGCPRKAGSCGRWSRTIYYKDIKDLLEK